MFAQLSEKLNNTLKNLRGKGRLSEADIDEALAEIRIALLEGDVALPVATDFVSRIREQAIGESVSKSINPGQQVTKIVHAELMRILGSETRRPRFAKNPPTVFMLLGLQGAGKTTLAGKLAKHFAREGHTPLLVAADLQRPNAVDQLKIVGEQAQVPVFAPEPGNGVGDAVSVSKRAIDEAKKSLHDIVIIDTAGRLAIDEDLTQQAHAIKKAVNPDETFLVIDAMIGQDSVNTAEQFLNKVGFDGIVLTKLDGDARGGAALSLVETTKLPIFYASTGEKLDDFDLFHPDRLANRILDMGDVLSLIEQAERAFDTSQQERFAQKISSGEEFTLEDFLEQLQGLKNMGSLSKMLTMMPGMAQAKKQIEAIDDKELVRTEAIIQSMKPEERKDPKLLDGNRRAKIAQGAGVEVSEVNNLIKRFSEAQKLMRRAQTTGSIPGVPNSGFSKQKSQKQKPKKGARKSGNPAKRALEEKGIQTPKEEYGSGFKL
ncbi:MAG: signal recognition particle protein [Candidatus Nanopelagicales bacterium]